MTRLPILKILTEAILLPIYNKKRYSSALVIPTIILVSIWALWIVVGTKSQILGWGFYLLYFLGFSAFAITCHRLVLVDENSSISNFSIETIKRIAIFLLWLFFIYILVSIAHMFSYTIGLNLLRVFDIEYKRVTTFDELIWWMNLVFTIPGMYILGRSSLIFPSAAIDIKRSIRWSWQQTKGNGARMFIIVGIFPWLLSMMLSILWRENATLVEQTLLWILTYFGLAIEVFALSLTYKELQNSSKEQFIEV